MDDIHELNLVVYPFYIWVCDIKAKEQILSNFSYYEDKNGYKIDESDLFPKDNGFAMPVCTHDRNKVGALICLNNRKNLAKLCVHESAHAADIIMELINVKSRTFYGEGNNTEQYAYLIEAIFDFVYKSIKKK